MPMTLTDNHNQKIREWSLLNLFDNSLLGSQGTFLSFPGSIPSKINKTTNSSHLNKLRNIQVEVDSTQWNLSSEEQSPGDSIRNLLKYPPGNEKVGETGEINEIINSKDFKVVSWNMGYVTVFRRVHYRKLTWLAGTSTIWRCISY